MLDFAFDVICISELKLMNDVDHKVNISLEGYQDQSSTPTEATKGGVNLR